jgi:hypothetical protein
MSSRSSSSSFDLHASGEVEGTSPPVSPLSPLPCISPPLDVEAKMVEGAALKR